MKEKIYQTDFAGRKLILETGKMAGLAAGSVTVRYGDTVVLAAVSLASEENEGADFLPLLVDYEEKFYAAGKISGSRFIKREGRPSDSAILNARLIDRSIRPLFPKEFRRDIQVIVTILSVDKENDPDFVSIIATSAALLLSGAPFSGPIGAIRVGLKGDELILNPTVKQVEEGSLDLILSGTEDRVLMVQGEAKEVSEKLILKAIALGQKNMGSLVELQKKMEKECVTEKEEYIYEEEDIHLKVSNHLGSRLQKIVRLKDKTEREAKINEFEAQVLAAFEGNYKQIEIKNAFDRLLEKEVRKAILEDDIRPDGRGIDEIRPIKIEVGVLPRTHGSALFSRGQTQALSITTLDSPSKEQMIDTMEEEATKRFFHHYNFPPYSTGEVSPLRGASRREIGHGYLAEKALKNIIPSKNKFPYTIRVVTEILSSNGSSSMAAVCGSSLSLMDAGVPIKKVVSGIAMGLVTSEDREKKKIENYKILTDLQGIEDFAGDMDFKIAGTNEGITALQLDVKIPGITPDIFREAFTRSRKARLYIIDEMNKVISRPRQKVSQYAPKIKILHINPDKIRDIIGPGGRQINEIIDECGVSIDIEDDGSVYISSIEEDGLTKAVDWVKSLTREVKVGEVFKGKVTRIMDFGAFVEILPNQEGMVHISQISDKHIDNIHDVLKVGDVVDVVVIEIDEQNRINLSMKAAPKKRD